MKRFTSSVAMSFILGIAVSGMASAQTTGKQLRHPAVEGGMTLPQIYVAPLRTPVSGGAGGVVPGAGDNLGDHVMRRVLNANGNRIVNIREVHMVDGGRITNVGRLEMSNSIITGLADAGADTDAVNLRTLASRLAGARDNMGDQVIRQAVLFGDAKAIDMSSLVREGGAIVLDGSGRPTSSGDGLVIGRTTIGNLAAPQEAHQAANRKYVDDMAAGARDNLGDHNARMNINAANYRIVNLATPDAVADAATKGYVDSLMSTAGKYTAADGLSLASNAFSVNATVVRTTGSQSIGGAKRFTDQGTTFNTQVQLLSDSHRFLWFKSAGGSNRAAIYVENTGENASFTLFDKAGVGGGLNLNSTNKTVRPYNLYSLSGGGRQIVSVADPVEPEDAVNLRTLDRKIGEIEGTGGTGGGTTYTAGTGISFTGTGVKTIATDATVVRTSGQQQIDDLKIFRALNTAFQNRITVYRGIGRGSYSFSNAPQGGKQAAFELSVDGNEMGNLFFDGSENITGGLLINKATKRIAPTGGFSFHGDGQVIGGVADPVADTDAVNLRTLQAAVGTPAGGSVLGGSGITVTQGGGASTVSADATVVRTSGSQEIGGAKSFTTIVLAQGGINNSSQKIINLADPSTAMDAVNLRTLQQAIADVPDANTTYAAGSGLALAGTTFSADASVIRTDGDQVMNDTKRFAGAVRLGTAVRGLEMTSEGITTYGAETNLGMSIGPVNDGYAASAGTPFDGTLRVWANGADSAVTTNLEGRGSYQSPVWRFSISRPEGTAIDPGDDGYGAIMALGYRSVRVYRPLEVNGEFYHNAPDTDFRTYGRSFSANTGKVDLNSNGQNIELDARRFSRTDIAGTGNGQVIIWGDLQVNGTARASGGHVTSSDERLKENIAALSPEEGMAMVRRFEPVTYDLKASGAHAAGVIAQNLQDVMPYAVSEGEDGMLGVEYTQMLAPVISAVQSLDNRVIDLDRRMGALEGRLEAMEASRP